MRIDALIFDADGTLVDSEVAGLDVLHELACAQGLKLTREQMHQQFRGVRMAHCVAWIAAQLPQALPSFEADFTAQIRAAMASRFRQGLQAMPGAPELLARLRIPFCVATNGPREKVELTLGLSGLLPWISKKRIFCAYEVGSFKPDPGLFLHAARALQAAPEHCAVVEDSLPGIEAGLAAGMQVFAVCPPEVVPAALAARIRFIRHLSELAPLTLQAAA
jgi:HAD superfamily hydrolase (TIGR01509 family)